MFYLFRLFYSFLPLHNPIGFGAADFIELALALLLVTAALAWQKSSAAANRLEGPGRIDFTLALAEACSRDPSRFLNERGRYFY